MSNRLLEDLPPSFLWISKKVQDAPYAALKRADLHEALESQSALRPPSFVVQKAVTDFYATFQGHCHIQPLPAGAPLELHSTPFYTLSSSSSTLSSRGGGGAKPTASSSSSSSAPSSSKYSSTTSQQPPVMNHSVGTPSSQTPRGSSHHSTPTTTTTTTITAATSRADGPSLLGAPSSGPPPEASLLSTPSSLLPTPQSLLSAPKMDDYRIYQLKQNEAQSKICPYFGTPKGCRRGESCGLLHIPK